MSFDIAVKVDGLSKCYQIYQRPNDRLKELLSFGGKKKYSTDFWALKNVSFEIFKGESIGVIGCNGSGKSTLLQLICGTLNPTEGQLHTDGRIAALLELGAGFNPEFTGKENVYLNASVLGLSREEINARFESIVSFADIGQFIDQPLKTYSSGMMVRLAFSVAINVDPDILIVDEALSVGDELFQRKCFSRIEAIRNNGATILFVSHSGAQIIELCDRAILLDGGEKIAIGNPKEIVAQYQKLMYAPKELRNDLREKLKTGRLAGINNLHETERLFPEAIRCEAEDLFEPGLIPHSSIEFETHGAWIGKAKIENLNAEQVNYLQRRRRYRFSYMVRFEKSARNVRFSMLIKTPSGLELGGAISDPVSPENNIALVPAGMEIGVWFDFTCNLNPGAYFFNAGVLGDTGCGETYLHRVMDVCAFKVLPVTSNLATATVDFHCAPSFSFVNPSPNELPSDE